MAVSGLCELSADVFVHLGLCRLDRARVSIPIELRDAFGGVQAVIETAPQLYSEFCLAVVQALPVDLARSERSEFSPHVAWEYKSLEDRAVIRLHTLCERIKMSNRMEFRHFVFRSLEHAGALAVRFNTDGEDLEQAVVSIGRTVNGPMSFQGVLPANIRWQDFIVPTSPGLKT